MCFVVKGTEALRNPKKAPVSVEHDLISAPLPLQVRLERERRHTQSKQLAQGLGKLSLLFFWAKLSTQIENGGTENRESDYIWMSISNTPLNFLADCNLNYVEPKTSYPNTDSSSMCRFWYWNRSTHIRCIFSTVFSDLIYRFELRPYFKQLWKVYAFSEEHCTEPSIMCI